MWGRGALRTRKAAVLHKAFAAPTRQCGSSHRCRRLLCSNTALRCRSINHSINHSCNRYRIKWQVLRITGVSRPSLVRVSPPSLARVLLPSRVRSQTSKSHNG